MRDLTELNEDQSVRLVLKQDNCQVVVHRVSGLEIAVFSRKSQTRETANEDAAVVIPMGERSAVMAVADGAGGLRGGENASNLAVRLLADTLVEQCETASLLRASILDGIERANDAIIQATSGSATTLAVVEYHAGEIRPYHVGDSMILVTGQRGRVKLLTVSHSPVGFAIEAGVLDAEAAMWHKDRHLVSNVVGDAGMRIELGASQPLARRDTVVLASDGLFDNLRQYEIVERIRKGPLQKSLSAMAKLATKRMSRLSPQDPGKPDDLTIIAFRRSL